MKTVKGKPVEKPCIKKRGLYCTKCHTIVVSLHRHDFVSCKCGSNEGIFVDGGDDYFRFGGKGVETGEYRKVEIKIIFEKEGKKDADVDRKK